MKLLVTGATGKVGTNFLGAFHSCPRFKDWNVVALCNNRLVEKAPNLQPVIGSIADSAIVAKAMDGATHVLHMAAVKETPAAAIDVAVKGMFLLLEAARKSSDLKQFILLSGDCAVGHIFQEYSAPITENSSRKSYQGCYPLVKVLEEVMLEQYQIQYGLNGCILRAPWIMEKDDFKFALAFGPDQFGGPAWSSLISAEDEAACLTGSKVPLMQDCKGQPLRRNFVHVDDVVTAILAALDNPDSAKALFHVTMDEPVDYAEIAAYLARTRSMDAIVVPTPFHSNWLDNSKAKQHLAWRPENDFERLVERAWSYRRAADEPRKVWYPG